jgi:hypothetical protein
MREPRVTTMQRGPGSYLVHAWIWLVAAFAASLAAQVPTRALAQAEPAQGPQTPPPPPPPGYSQTPPPPPPVQSTAALAPTAEDYATQAGNVPPGVTPREFKFETPRDYPRNEFGFMVGVPIWFSPPDAGIDAGVSFEARFAHRYGALAPEFTFGWQINWLSTDRLPSSLQHNDVTLDAFFFSAGLRVYMLPEATVSPFISGAFDFSLWHFTGDNNTYCNYYYYCNTVANYDPTVGFSGRVGVAFIPNPRWQLEVGARVAMAFPIGPFDRTQGWVMPYLGFVWRI